ncbi:MAG: TonB-dependent receptor [Burkholderiales bacterium]|nr:TonB-dependent receptor [Burkholderiales bacterium]
MYSNTVIAAITLALATHAFAQEEAVVVTATRFPEKRLEHPIGVTVVTRDQITNSTAKNLPDLLSRYAGINTRNNSGSPDVAIDVRGFGASGDQNTLVLLDGQRLNDIDLTTVRWSAIPLEAIERIEIQRGGGAVLYGSGASGGTINIITRSPIAGDKSAVAGASYGSYDTKELRAALNIAGDNTGFSLNASQYNSDNYRVNNRLEQGDVLGDLRWTGNRAGLVFKFGLDNQNLRLPGARTAAQLDSDRRGSATPGDYSARDGRQATLTGRYAFDSADFAVDLSYRDTKRIGFFDDYVTSFGLSTFTDTRSKVWALTPRLKVPYRLLARDNVLIFGVDVDYWDYQALRAARFEQLGAPQTDLAATQKDHAFYMQNHTAISAATKLTLGGRLQQVDIAANDRANPASYANISQSRSPRAWELALRHNFDPALALYGKIGTSFRVATVDEMYSQFGGPGFDSFLTPLEPQTSRDQEIGLEYKSVRGRMRASLYRMDLRNEIHFNALTFTNMNLSPTQREGVELEGSWRLGESLNLFGSYTHALAVFREGVYVDALTGGSVDLSGKNVPLVPRNKADLGLSWQLAERTRLSGALAYVGEQYYDNDQTNTFPGQMPAYLTADAKLSHLAGPWTLSLSANNLTDKKYYSYAIRNGAGTSFNAYPMAGRNFLLSAAYRWP